MPIGYAQIPEVVDVLQEYITPEVLKALLNRLRRTQAYISNTSFSTTVERIGEELTHRGV